MEIVWRADLSGAAFGKITDTSMKMGRLSVNVLLQKRRLRTKWAKTAVCP
ncbi:hypothetical protein [Ligilactobacillus ruminis]|nr:hypothetical protein [Ligilactobacillus ruminis]